MNSSWPSVNTWSPSEVARTDVINLAVEEFPSQTLRWPPMSTLTFAKEDASTHVDLDVGEDVVVSDLEALLDVEMGLDGIDVVTQLEKASMTPHELALLTNDLAALARVPPLCATTLIAEHSVLRTPTTT